LETELKAVQPAIVVCLGATAAQSMFGKVVRLNETRGKFLGTPWAPAVMVTVHPSAILRHPDRIQQEAEYRQLVQELILVRRKLLARSS
jgi:DNA polymerase